MLQFPHPRSSPWTDPNDQVWVHNGASWNRFRDPLGKVAEAPYNGMQHARVHGAWEALVLDDVYHAAYDSPPNHQTFGRFLETGDVYYNPVKDDNKTWDGIRWQPFAANLDVITIAEFTWENTGGVSVGTPLTGPDVYGNTPAEWDSNKSSILVTVGGKRLMQEVGNATAPGQFTIDYVNAHVIPFGSDFAAGEIVHIQEFETLPEQPALRPALIRIRNYLSPPGNPAYNITSIRVSPTARTADIYGGNFDPTTNIEIDANIEVTNFSVVSAERLNFTVRNLGPEASYAIKVFNATRPHFGNDLSIIATT